MSNFCMTFMVIYVGMSNCYALPTKSFFEQFNEVFVAFTNYHLMCFADFVQEQRTRDIVGWSMIGCVSFNLAVNIGFIMFGSIKQSYYTMRTRYYQGKLKRLKKRIEQRRVRFVEDQASGQVQQVFSKRPQTLLIDARFSSESEKDPESSIANLVSSSQISGTSVMSRPPLLPGQIEYKPRP